MLQAQAAFEKSLAIVDEKLEGGSTSAAAVLPPTVGRPWRSGGSSWGEGRQ